MPQRRVRRPNRPINDLTPGIKGHIKRFFLSFTPSHFREYWLSRAGLVRFGKLAGAGAVFVFLVFLWYAKDLPTPNKINARIMAETTKFYDASGQHLLYEIYGDKSRSIIKSEEIPEIAKQATIAIEDKDFYRHGSFSFVGYLRAAFIDVTQRSTRQGGSTITQQYVKNALLDPTDHSFSRKIKELILSIEIGQFYNKEAILTMYLNEIPYGNRAYGIESACKAFFPHNVDKANKDQRCAKNLNLSESALLAALLNGPGLFSPYGAHKDLLISRQNLVLDLMAEQGYVTKAQADAAKWTLDDLKDSKKLAPTPNLYADLDKRWAHFAIYAQDYMETKYGAAAVNEGGLKVYTTIDYDKQVAAYDAVQKNMQSVKNGGGSNAALVSTDPKSGHILAMIGGYDYSDPTFGQVNVATSKRQPGSSFKPIVYSTLFAKNKDAACAKARECSTYGPGTTFYDVPTDFGGNPAWKPNNFGNKNYGILSARQALAGSLNIPAAKAIMMAGVSNSMETAKNLGITTLGSRDAYPSLVLGTGGVQLSQMANAYESFANGGLHYEQTPILKVLDSKGRVLEDNTKPKKPKQALDPQVASLMADVLSDNSAKDYVFHGELALRNNCPNNSATGCVHVGVKTGTTEHFNDAWTMGFTQDMVAGVWVGNNDNQPMKGVAAADIAAPIWKTYMNSLINGRANDPFPRASGIKTITLDKDTGRLPTAGTKNKTTDIFPSWYTPMSASAGKSATIDTVSKKLATQCTPEQAKDTIYSSAILPEITKSENPTQYQNWLEALQKRGYSTSGGDLPSEYDDVHQCGDSKPIVQIKGLRGGGPYSFNVQVTAGSGTPTKLELYFDDQKFSIQNISGSGTYPVTYSPNVTGSHILKAVVTDNKLYIGSDEQTVTVTNVGGSSSGDNSFNAITPSDGSQVPAGSVTFSWSSDPDSSSYRLYINDSPQGSSTSSTHKSVTLAPGTYTWYVKSDNGNQTDPVTFKVKL